MLSKSQNKLFPPRNNYKFIEIRKIQHVNQSLQGKKEKRNEILNLETLYLGNKQRTKELKFFTKFAKKKSQLSLKSEKEKI